MEIKGRFDHFNFNVLDLEKSIRFYEKALGLKEVRRKTASDGSFILVYMGDGETSFTLELTWLRDRKEPYDLGEGEYHLCLRVPGDYDKVRAFHKEMGCVCYLRSRWILDRNITSIGTSKQNTLHPDFRKFDEIRILIMHRLPTITTSFSTFSCLNSEGKIYLLINFSV